MTVAASHQGQLQARRRRQHDHRAHDRLVLPGLLVVAPATARFAFARTRLAQGGWEPAYKLSSGRSWWRCLRLAASHGDLHPCTERLGKHLSWHLGDGVSLTNIRELLAGYAAYHGLSVRTAWTDWARLVEAGWLAPTRAPANQGPGRPQGPGSGRAARYVLTAPAALVDQLRARPRRPAATSLDTFSSLEASPSPSVPPPRQDQLKGWVTLSTPTVAERRDASALLAGCHEPWRRQRPNHALLDRADWQRLLPLVAQVHRQHPDLSLSAVLTDRVASARSLPAVSAWRLWQLLRQPPQQPTRPDKPLRPPTTVNDTADQHLTAVRTFGGPAAARAALATAGHQPPHRRPPPPSPPGTSTTTGTPKAPHLHLPVGTDADREPTNPGGGTMPTCAEASRGGAD